MPLRLGLCCIFVKEPVRFRTTTAKALLPLAPHERIARLDAICLHNAASLEAAIRAVIRLGIGAFRILSPVFPRMTHPVVGYRLEDLPAAPRIQAHLAAVKAIALSHHVRLSFHPDQFVVLSSPNPKVHQSSLRELLYHGMLADLVGAEVINIHGGGAYGNPRAALKRLASAIADLPPTVRSRLTLENDDRTYTVRHLLPVCAAAGVPLVYDVHHHRCLPDGLTEEEATELAAATWGNREPYVHISSPLHPWGQGDPKPHAQYIHIDDVPPGWIGRAMTVDVEAKAKELAVLRLRQALQERYGISSVVPQWGQ